MRLKTIIESIENDGKGTYEFHLSTEPSLKEGTSFTDQIRTNSDVNTRGDMGAESDDVIYSTDSPEEWYDQFKLELEQDAPEFIPKYLYIVKVKNPSTGSALPQATNDPDDVVVIQKVPNRENGEPDFVTGRKMLNNLEKSNI